ncbi:PGF-pre-PGF domain-containing protein [Nanoarchaeota archaeon]
MLLVLLIAPIASAYGVTFYSSRMNPQYGKIYESVEPGTQYTIENTKDKEVAITKITFSVNREAKNGGITIYNLLSQPELPDFPENDTYEINELKYGGFVPHDTTNLVYEFRVAKAWLEEQAVPRNSIVIHALNKKTNFWEELTTKITGEDDTYVFYKTESTGYHFLLIGQSQGDSQAESMIETKVEEIEEKTEAEAPAAEDKVDIATDVTEVKLGESAPAPAPVAAPAPAAPQPTPAAPPAETIEKDGSKTLGALVFLAIAVILVVIYLVFSKKKVIGSSVDRELNKYIRESMARGKSREEVRNRLTEVGWHHDRIDKALAKFKTAEKPIIHDVEPEPAKPKPAAKPKKKAAGAKKK